MQGIKFEFYVKYQTEMTIKFLTGVDVSQFFLASLLNTYVLCLNSNSKFGYREKNGCIIIEKMLRSKDNFTQEANTFQMLTFDKLVRTFQQRLDQLGHGHQNSSERA